MGHEQLTGGQALARSLKAYGVDTIFALPGAQLDNFFDALYEERDSIRVIHTRHEQATSYMALGYAQATGKPGVCLVVPGPGVLNAGAGLCTAWAVNAPVLCIAGQIPSNQIDQGIGALHEIPDQLGLLGHLTKWAARIERPADAPALVEEAFRQLRSGRPRPVAVEMSPDIMGLTADVQLLPPAAAPDSAPEPDPDALEHAARLLGQAKYPVIMAGGGSTEAGAALANLAETLQAPVIMTPNGLGALDTRHPLALTVYGGSKIWPQVDVVLAVGTRFDRALLDWGDEGVTVIRIDIDPAQIDLIKAPEVGIVADARRGLAELAERVTKHSAARTSRVQEIAAVKAQVEDELFEIQPQQSIVQVIREELPDDGVFVGDITQVGAYSEFGLPVYAPRTYIGAGFQGTLGFGLTTAMGAKVGRPDAKVISASGDGGFMYSMPDLATAKQHGINIVAIVFNDGAYGNVRWIQANRYGGRHLGSDLENPDFVKLGESFGIAARRATTAEELRTAIREGFDLDTPMLIDYPTPAMPAVRHLYRGKRRG